MNNAVIDEKTEARQGAAQPGSSGHLDAASMKAGLLAKYQDGPPVFREPVRDAGGGGYVIQTMPEASPTKWHLAHVSWFFETFVLQPNLPGYQSRHPQYAFLFNSYYNAAKQNARPQREIDFPPHGQEHLRAREYVDVLMKKLISGADEPTLARLAPLITLGLNHEQQHQELLLTDIKHVFWMNPLRPVFRQRKLGAAAGAGESRWRHFDGGIHAIGHAGGGFCFDNETPRHDALLEPFALATRLLTNREYLAFMEDGGYARPELWLSLGWNTVNERGWNAPLYWEKKDGAWWMMTLSGMREVELDEPVCHLSYFEADACARWAGARLPTEAEWEVAAGTVPVEGNFAEGGYFHSMPRPDSSPPAALFQMFGEVWQWTQSSYSPYPGFQTAPGALGEYNGKFMCNQYVLRGASCATPRTHARRSYRNFFPPDARWQFMGLRLARDLK